MSLVRALALALLGFAMLVPRRATALEEPHVTLEYDAGAPLFGCPSSREFKQIVSQQLGYDPFRESQSRRVRVSVEATESGLRGRVEWRNATGTRDGEQNFSSRNQDCGKFTKTIGFAIVVQIQLLGVPEPPLAKSLPSPTPLSAPPHAEAIGSAEPTQARSFWVGLGPSVALGLAPALVLDGRVFGALHWSRASFEVGAEGSWPSLFREVDGSGFWERSFAATLAACAEGGRWSACALAKLGAIRVRGTGVDDSRSSAGMFAQAGLRLAMTQSLAERLSAVVRVEGLKQLKPWTVTLNQAQVWTTPQFAATCGIDIAIHFP